MTNDPYFSIFHYKKSARPVLDAVQKNVTKKSRVLEIGCGEGHLLQLLAKSSKKVIAIDKSKKKLLSSAKKSSHLKNVQLIHHPFLGLSAGKQDVIVAVNSLFEGDYEEIITHLSKIHSLLAKNGKFIGVFPAMESLVYLAHLHLFTLIGANKKITSLVKKINKKFFSAHKFDFFGNHKIANKKQKMFYSFELELLLNMLGFKKVELKKLYYPSKALTDAGMALRFNHDALWGWLVIAKK